MLNIRPVELTDVMALQALVERADCVFGLPLARTWQVETRVKEAVTAFSYGEGESAANYIFVACDNDKLVGMLELNTLMGYAINCLSYSCSKTLHRSDMLAICHEQRVLTLDQGLLGQHALSLCYVDHGKEVIAQELISAALAFLVSEPDHFSGLIYLSLPSDDGESFWRATGMALTGIPFQNCNHHHAELLPQTPLFECFLSAAFEHDGNKKSPESTLASWLFERGFGESSRLSVFDGSPILMLSLDRVA